MKDKINRYFNDTEFRYTIYRNRIHILNYLKILSLEENRISILFQGGRILFRGRGFVLEKLMDQEVSILGEVLGVDVYE
ncbi:MAG: YabP/YqfC family sporulation protein, partial [Bacilli bacterium]|nr:YabP/YqfC family sporulation protein [Bacilli bacterium]